MNPRVLLLGLALLLVATTATATSFVVPTDAEMVDRSQAIVTGTVEGAYVQEVENIIETVYEVRVERGLKGTARANALIRVVSPGGVSGDGRGLIVPGSAHFRQGDQVLLFLTRAGDRWTTTDMTLGKFRFVTSTAGARLLVRDMEDVVGWDHAGRVHHEKVRREEGFLRYVEERARGRNVEVSYVVDAAEVTLESEPTPSKITTNAAPFPAATYTSWVSNMPVRWPNMSAGVAFWKRSDQNMPGTSDGGVSMIQQGLAAWTNDCASLINLTYAGQRATPSANHDGVNVVEYNDPQQRISGSWGGSGTVGITFISFAGTHSFSGQTWLNITDADVVFQDGYTGSNVSFFPAMTHELGHGIGWRHSNQDYATGGACNSATQECTTQAIMNSSVSGNLTTLQAWDIHAAESVYPGGTCGTPPPSCTAPAITANPASTTINAGQSVTLSVSATGTAPLSYQWYVGASGNTSSPVGGNSNTLTVSPTSTTSYWVRVSNSCGSTNSATATVTVTTPPPPPPSSRRATRGDYDGDGRTDITIWRPSSGRWYWNRSSTGPGDMLWGQNGDVPAPADYDGDGRWDIAVFRPSTGMWYWNRSTLGGGQLQFGQNGDIPVPADYDGDRVSDPAVFRPSTGTWFIRLSRTATTRTQGWGENGDIPKPGDFDGDRIDDIAVWRPSNGTWYYLRSSLGGSGVQWGTVGDQPVVGDFDSDGRDDVGVYRPSNGWWLIIHSTLGVGGVPFGVNGDVAVPGDYDGDGRTDVAIWRPSTGYWYIRQSATVTVRVVLWGQSGDQPQND